MAEDQPTEEVQRWCARFTLDATWHESTNGNIQTVNEYCILKTLGSGSFGNVFLCERQVGELPYRQFAMKVFSKIRLRKFKQQVLTNEDGSGMMIETGIEKVQNEIQIMQNLFHKNVVLLFEVLDNPASDNLALILEYLPNGPSMVYDTTKLRFYSPSTGATFTENQAAKYFHDLISGLQFLHDHRIYHRDIKPENLLISKDDTLRISDFGSAIQFPETDESTSKSDGEENPNRKNNVRKIRQTAGTIAFYAPEICAGESYRPDLADIWAAGVTLYCFLFGRLPFSGKSYQEMMNHIQETEPDFMLEETKICDSNDEQTQQQEVIIQSLSEEGIQLLRKLLCKNPEERISSEEALEDDWVFNHMDLPAIP